MNTQKKYRTQTKTVTIAAGAAANDLQEADLQLDRKFDRCIGVATIEKTSSGVFFETGVSSPIGAEIDLAGADLLKFTTAVPKNQRFTELNIPVVDGEAITSKVKNSSGAVAPAGGIVVQFIYLLEKDEAAQ